MSSSYAKILGETNFPIREFPRSGSKAKDGEKKRRRERLNDGKYNGQAMYGARKHTWANIFVLYIKYLFFLLCSL